MKFPTGWLAVLSLASWVGTAHADWPAFERDIQQDVLAVDAAGGVLADLAAVSPPPRGIVREWATQDRGYLLVGDLFGTGKCFALYELPRENKPDAPTLALAERKDPGGWELRGLWKTPLEWVSKDEKWAGTGKPYYPDDLPNKPFVLEDVVGDKTPEVIVAGELLKYRQVSYLLKFDGKTQGLSLLAHAMAKPAKAGKYVRLYEASGNKATWEQWTFLEWKDGKLAERASWRSETPYNNVDAPFYLASATAGDGTSERYRVDFSSGKQEPAWNYEITEDSKPFAKIAVNWGPNEGGQDNQLMEAAWIFEKLTGLPRDEFPERYGPEKREKPKLERLEDAATVVVEPAPGNEKAQRRFAKPE